MRWPLGVFLIVMLSFAAVQYNDPDGPLWMLLYGAAAVWCAIALWRPGTLRGTPALLGLAALSIAVYVLGFLWEIRTFNPDFLTRSMMSGGVETTREAFGLLIAALVTAWVLWADGRAGQRAALRRS
jgi:Transmembrane family 220, helix